MNSIPPAFKYALVSLFWLTVAFFLWRLAGKWPNAEDWILAISIERINGIFIFGLAFICASVVRSIRWGLLLRMSLMLPWHRLLFGYSWCFLIAVIVPFRFGELARPIWVSKQGGSFAEATGMIILERINDFIVLLTILALVTTGPNFSPWLNKLGFLLLAGLVIGYTILLYSSSALSGFFKRWRYKAREPYSKIIGGLIAITDTFRYRRLNMVTLVLTVIIWAIMAIGVDALVTAQLQKPTLAFSVSLSVLALVNLSSLIPSPPGNIGVFEVAAVYSLVAFSVPTDQAIITAVIYHAMILLMTFCCGFLGWIGLRLTRPIGLPLKTVRHE